MVDSSQGAEQPSELVYWWAPRGSERVFDLAGWPQEAIAMAKALLTEDGMAHSWEDACLVVDAEQRDDAAALLDEVVAASLPHLDEDSNRTAYELADWPDYELETLRAALEDAGVLFEWTDEDELLVYEADEARVDELFDRLDLRGPDPGVELDGEALTSLLTTLFVASDRLADNPDDADAVLDAHRSIQEVEQLAVPYGMNPDGWRVLVADAGELRRLIESEAAGEGEVGPRATATDVSPDSEQGAGGHIGGFEDDEEDEEEVAVELFGDDAIVAVAARVRDHLKRLL